MSQTIFSTPLNQWFSQYNQQIVTLIASNSQHLYEKFEEATEQEFLVPITEKQVNLALDQFVTKNVGAVLDLHLDLHDNWLRLYATVNVQGIFAKLNVDLRLVHVQLDRHRQRFVFGQLSETRVETLHTNNYLKTKIIRFALWVFHGLLKKDPLGLILGKINLTRQKEDILYLDIGRWLNKNKKIMNTLKKVQVNHGFLAEQQLVLKANGNISELISVGGKTQLISEDDNPEKAKAKQLTTPTNNPTEVTKEVA